MLRWLPGTNHFVLLKSLMHLDSMYSVAFSAEQFTFKYVIEGHEIANRICINIFEVNNFSTAVRFSFLSVHGIKNDATTH